MAKKAAEKKTKKEIEAEKRSRWMKIGLALLFVVIMVTAALTYLINPAPISNTNNTRTTTFDSIVDAVSLIPPTAQYVRYVDLASSPAIRSAVETAIGPNLPNASLLGATANKDALASFPFPTLGYTIEPSGGPQVVVLSDLGKNFDNTSFPQTTVSGVPMRTVPNTAYAFSTGTYPVVSGRQQYVAGIVGYMSQVTRSSSAYPSYSDLFDQATASNQSASRAKLAVVGLTDALSIGDRYYAGITPLNETMYDYRIVIHLNQTLNETQKLDFIQRWELGAGLYGLEPMASQFKDNYLLLAAKGSADNCVSDMVNWEFLKG